MNLVPPPPGPPPPTGPPPSSTSTIPPPPVGPPPVEPSTSNTRNNTNRFNVFSRTRDFRASPPPPGFLFRNRGRRGRRIPRRRGFWDISANRENYQNLTNTFTNQIMNILNNSLYDIQPRRNIQPEQYESLIETDNWTNLSTRYNLPLDTICPITQNSLSTDTHQEAIRINSCGHVFSSHLREWFNYSSVCPVCRHDLHDDISGNNTENNTTEENTVTNTLTDVSNNPLETNTIMFDFRFNTPQDTNILANAIVEGITSFTQDSSNNIFEASFNDGTGNQSFFDINSIFGNNTNTNTTEYQDNYNSYYNTFINDMSNNLLR